MPANEATVADLDEAIYETVFTRALFANTKIIAWCQYGGRPLEKVKFY